MLGRAESFLRNPAALLLIVVAALMSIGLTMVYSASGARAGLEQRRARAAELQIVEEGTPFHHGSNYAKKQLLMASIGIVILIGLMKTPIEWIERAAPYVLGISIFVLILLLVTPLGFESKGARRWMRIGPFVTQPSEFAKVGFVVFMAKFLSEKRHVLQDFRKGFLPALGIFTVFCALVVLEKDLGMTALTAIVVLCMWALARMRTTHLLAVAMSALFAGTILILTQSYRMNRILAFLDPEKYATTHAYQLNQSLIAIGSGGIFGRGLGMGMQKYHFLSESHTDFIFSIVCEELGFVGAISVVLLFLAFVLLGFRIAYKAPDVFGALTAAGLTLMIGWGVFINLFVVVGLGPTKGLALPFLSYGGSSMIASLMCVGILLNIGNYSFARQKSTGVLA